MQDPPELCPPKEVVAVTFYKQRGRGAVKISRLLKIKRFKVGVLSSSVDFPETACLSRLLAVLEFSIFVNAEAGGLHSIACNPSLCAQTPAPALPSDEN